MFWKVMAFVILLLSFSVIAHKVDVSENTANYREQIVKLQVDNVSLSTQNVELGKMLTAAQATNFPTTQPAHH